QYFVDDIAFYITTGVCLDFFREDHFRVAAEIVVINEVAVNYFDVDRRVKATDMAVPRNGRRTDKVSVSVHVYVFMIRQRLEHKLCGPAGGAIAALQAQGGGGIS